MSAHSTYAATSLPILLTEYFRPSFFYKKTYFCDEVTSVESLPTHDRSSLRLFPRPVQVLAVFIPPSPAILFLYRRPSIVIISLHRRTAHEEEASLKRMDLAEERVGLHERARHVNRW